MNPYRRGKNKRGVKAPGAKVRMAGPKGEHGEVKRYRETGTIGRPVRVIEPTTGTLPKGESVSRLEMKAMREELIVIGERGAGKVKKEVGATTKAARPGDPATLARMGWPTTN